MKTVYGLLGALWCTAGTSAALAAAPEPISLGARLAASCAACHGFEGRSVQRTPVLAGVDRRAFLDALHGFRDGSRKATVMHRLARGYSETELAALADYYAALPAPAAPAQGK